MLKTIEPQRLKRYKALLLVLRYHNKLQLQPMALPQARPVRHAPDRTAGEAPETLFARIEPIPLASAALLGLILVINVLFNRD